MDSCSCAGCKSDIASNEFISCHGCKLKYDLMCANLSPKRFRKMTREAKTQWKCSECKSKQPKTGNIDTPIRSASHSMIDDKGKSERPSEDSNVTVRRNRSVDSHLTQEKFKEILKKELMTEIEVMFEKTLSRMVSNQLKDINSRFVELQESMTYISGQYEDLKKHLDSTKSDMQCLKDENNCLKDELNHLTTRVKTLEDNNMKQQQWARLQNIEICGIPEDKDENTLTVVQKISKHIGVPIEPSEVEFAHRVQPRRATSTVRARPIVARLKHRFIKDKIMAAARKHRNLNASDVGIGCITSKIFINEHLTKENKILLSQCKQKVKELNFKFIWTKNCRIFVRKNEASPPISISSTADIAKIV
ncbi:uncharacterized protein [Epargyreus clarus]|uniref:uncharacterized protein n=1 Tax=Epargyreus clarus TaxID=520877 RepID=UPI003C2E22E3